MTCTSHPHPFDIGDEVRVTTGSYPFTTSEVGTVVSLSWSTFLEGVRYEVVWPAGLGLEFRGTPAHSVTQLRDHELVLVKRAPSKASPPAARPFEVGDWVRVTGDLPLGVGHIETVSTTVWSATSYLGEDRYMVVFPSGRRISGARRRDLILAEEPVRLPPPPAPAPEVPSPKRRYEVMAEPIGAGEVQYRVVVTQLGRHIWPTSQSFGPLKYYAEATALIRDHRAAPNSPQWDERVVYSVEV